MSKTLTCLNVSLSPNAHPDSDRSKPHLDDGDVRISTASSMAIFTGQKPVPASPLRSEALRSLLSSKPHYSTLKRLEEDEVRMMEAVSKTRRGMHRHKRDVYEVMSLYAVLLGVLFAAVAQSTSLACPDAWGPLILAMAVMVAAMATVCEKIRMIGEHKSKLKLQMKRKNDLFMAMNRLRHEGATVDLDDLRGTWQTTHKPRAHAASVQYSFWLTYGGIILLFLFVFSAIIVLSCASMLCSGCKC